jgi:putative cardiolipin synthase
MHNKVFVADNALAIFGGRNIGNEYFLRAEDGNFLDLDVLTAGDAVLRLSDSFDAYWNSEFAWPIDAIVAPRGDLAERRTRFDATTSTVSLLPVPQPPERLSRFATAPAELRNGALMLLGADAEVVADPVDKLGGTRVGQRAGTVRAVVGDAGRAARLEVYVVSPYFIPGAIGMESLRLNRRNGVRLRLLTNSLAATDEPAVHAGISHIVASCSSSAWRSTSSAPPWLANGCASVATLPARCTSRPPSSTEPTCSLVR